MSVTAYEDRPLETWRWYDHFWAMLGGRKNAKALLATALIAWYAVHSRATFAQFWPPILVSLGIMMAGNLTQKFIANGTVKDD